VAILRGCGSAEILVFFFDSRYASEVRKEYLLYLYPGSVRPGERADVPGEPMVSGVEKACKKEKKKRRKKSALTFTRVRYRYG